MIVFIDLTDKIIKGDKSFSFFNTVNDKFCEFSGSQTWELVNDFKDDFLADNKEPFPASYRFDIRNSLLLCPCGGYRPRGNHAGTALLKKIASKYERPLLSAVRLLVYFSAWKS